MGGEKVKRVRRNGSSGQLPASASAMLTFAEHRSLEKLWELRRTAHEAPAANGWLQHGDLRGMSPPNHPVAWFPTTGPSHADPHPSSLSRLCFSLPRRSPLGLECVSNRRRRTQTGGLVSDSPAQAEWILHMPAQLPHDRFPAGHPPEATPGGLSRSRAHEKSPDKHNVRGKQAVERRPGKPPPPTRILACKDTHRLQCRTLGVLTHPSSSTLVVGATGNKRIEQGPWHQPLFMHLSSTTRQRICTSSRGLGQAGAHWVEQSFRHQMGWEHGLTHSLRVSCWLRR
ncbi:hypothetical protein HDV57DRAFT_446527 [Trichoderma longibrachiatum]|uniref:Uncharacterized protein n=1 Tax=Trichoderma longibrachiatum ATCC 18648 TaxID=983965 RepID=A0A2T4CG65_TRILO|nr:hypothetical protein M440DRAFT_197921 [Trichoderma longibrachiatum ATCC 18648]